MRNDENVNIQTTWEMTREVKYNQSRSIIQLQGLRKGQKQSIQGNRTKRY